MTPFEEAGYTRETKFRVLRDMSLRIKEGDIVTLNEDDGTTCPWFITDGGREGGMWLPGMAADGYEDLEVYENERGK